MSRALGAAFLNHQVEQLEKSAANANANWRTRPQPPASPKRVQQPKRASQQQQRNSNGVNGQRRSFDDPKASEKDGGKTSHSNEKDANIIVIDASVLIHALPAVRFWVHEGRTEILIVPLEALNTLDMLKKGTSALAQRALAASRVLEAQVGVNGRVRVQRDEAFVLWDAIRFADPIEVEDATKGEEGNMVPALPDDPDTAPEWVRRTVCCARYEVDNAIAASPTTTTTTTTAPTATPAGAPGAPASAPSASPAVVLAVLVPSPDTARPLSAGDAAQNKHEPRATGTLVAHWAARAGVAVKGVPAAAPNPNVANANASSAGATSVGANVGANAGGGAGAGGGGGGAGGGRPRSNTSNSKRGGHGGIGTGGKHHHGGSGGSGGSGSLGKHSGGSAYGSGGGGYGYGAEKGSGGGSLVERPAAPLALGPGMIRVLARGERLDGV